ncbi:hypothetical protein [Ferruginibacter sp. SUN106]|uniref:COG1470 family protein n=1 Tax=Ferruginibacter sp. SUN106 TaxID=2978348 RepID=UPI003D3688F3
MLTITSKEFHEKLSVGNDEIILNGPPGNLRGHVNLRNNHEDAVRIKTLELIPVKQNSGAYKTDMPLQISCRLAPGEERTERILHRINPQTPPGTYESTLNVGGKARAVKMIVQPHIDISIYPGDFTFQDTTPGKTHTAVFTLTNMGNMPFQVPDIKHVAALDMDMLCKAFGIGFREKNAETYNQVMDAITKNVRNNLTDWARATIEEKGEIIAPGASKLIHLDITLPANCDAANDYNGSVRFWDKEITYSVKAHNDKKIK